MEGLEELITQGKFHSEVGEAEVLFAATDVQGSGVGGGMGGVEWWLDA